MLLGNKGNKYPLCMHLVQPTALLWCCIMICLWNWFLRPWSLEIVFRWLWSTAYTLHPSQARLQRGSTLLKLGRLDQAAADFSELVCSYVPVFTLSFAFTILHTVEQKSSEDGEGLNHSTRKWTYRGRGPYLNMCISKLVSSLPYKMSSFNHAKIWCFNHALVECLNGWPGVFAICSCLTPMSASYPPNVIWWKIQGLSHFTTAHVYY